MMMEILVRFHPNQLSFAQRDISATLDDWELSLVGFSPTQRVVR